ncbi:sigma-70 family RNA polymerase sigma factor [Cohnella panacarvi]|uniref:sigma-70 family RNA polymerase sigma factor n=1 Tax=Cohnella panacarvi TaxID=400776 RepID=UPI00047CF2BF|nr:sigma-70 family RNA polymerase sigma factor [Cohnella panacarvi]
MEWSDDASRARKGDKDAFVRAMRTLEVSMYQTAKAFLRSDADCADAMQETVLRAFRSIRGLKEPAYFKTWVIRILINECKRVLQRTRNVMTLDVCYDSGVREAGYDRVEMREWIDTLDESLRSIVLLYYYGELTIKEISEEMDLPEGTVKSRLHRAREILGFAHAGQTKGAGHS